MKIIFVIKVNPNVELYNIIRLVVCVCVYVFHFNPVIFPKFSLEDVLWNI